MSRDLKRVLTIAVLCIFGAGRSIAQNPTLGEGLDATQMVWTTGGNAAWFGQTNTTHDGVDAGQSGPIADNQQTWMQTSVTGPVTVSFWWKVDSEQDFDLLQFFIDGVEQANISGNVDWQHQIYRIVATGTHALRWSFTDDYSVTVGSNAAWIDQIQMLPPAPVISVLG